MDDLKNNPAEQREVETETTQANSPQAEVPTTGAQTTEGEAVQQTVSNEPKFQTEEERKAFQEMRLENKRLRDEISARKSNESAFSAFRPKPQVVPELAQFTDPLSGETNWAAYNQVQSQQMEAKAAQAAEERIDEFQARQKYPDLFSDPEVEQLIADQWFASKMRGESVSISQSAERVAKRFGRVVSKAEKSGAERALEQVTPKEQASLAVSNQTTAVARQQVASDQGAHLVLATRLGDDDALAERMSRVPWANK